MSPSKSTEKKERRSKSNRNIKIKENKEADKENED